MLVVVDLSSVGLALCFLPSSVARLSGTAGGQLNDKSSYNLPTINYR